MTTPDPSSPSSPSLPASPPPPPPPPYPIVDQFALWEPFRRGPGPLKIWKSRYDAEIPRIKPHEVLVYRLGDRFIVDARQLRADDDILLRASSVSVVSVRRGTGVRVEFEIDSKDGQKFKVRVNFVCSVVDPVVVVRDGQVNAADALLGYLMGYQDLFEVGLKHPVADVNHVRTEAALQVKAYMALRPPQIPGMEISLASVQVETPAVMANLGQLSNDQMVEFRKQQGEALLDAERRLHQLRQAAKIDEAIGGDPVRAASMSVTDGGLSSPQYLEQIRQMFAERQEREQAERLAAMARQYAVEDRDAQWEHAQLEIQRKDAQEKFRLQKEVEKELMKQLGDSGHFDLWNGNVADLLKAIFSEEAAGPAITAGDGSALTAGREQEKRAPEDNDGN